jgi:hypothetical protein
MIPSALVEGLQSRAAGDAQLYGRLHQWLSGPAIPAGQIDQRREQARAPFFQAGQARRKVDCR